MNDTKIPIAQPDLTGSELEYVTDCLTSTWISSSGKYISEFESITASYCGSNHGVSVSSGTTALHLALEALNIGAGDEVIVPNLTFAASANAVKHAHATPVLVDICREDGNINWRLIEAEITPRTKAIIPVHLFGNPCDMGAILAIARKHKIFVIEDCAESLGASWEGSKVGSFGDISCFSFFANKIITTGEGGMCVTNSRDLAERMRFLKNHGMDQNRRYWHPEVGFNYRMTNIQAAIGLAQIERIDSLLSAREKLANHYDAGLADIDGLDFLRPNQGGESVCWLYSLIVNDQFPVSRDGLIKELTLKGIESRPFFFPLNMMPPYKEQKSFPDSDYLSNRGLSLPTSSLLQEQEIERVLDAVRVSSSQQQQDHFTSTSEL